MVWLAVASLLGLAGASGWWLRRRLLIVTVHGPSMLPTHRDGDRLLVRRRAGHQVRTGDVVVVDLRRFGDQPAPDLGPVRSHVVKRVAAVAGEPAPAGGPAPASVDSARPVVPPGRLVLLGDNPAMSTDSRHYGFVPTGRVLGVVVRPLRRRGTHGCEPGANLGGTSPL